MENTAVSGVNVRRLNDNHLEATSVTITSNTNTDSIHSLLNNNNNTIDIHNNNTFISFENTTSNNNNNNEYIVQMNDSLLLACGAWTKQHASKLGI